MAKSQEALKLPHSFLTFALEKLHLRAQLTGSEKAKTPGEALNRALTDRESPQPALTPLTFPFHPLSF